MSDDLVSRLREQRWNCLGFYTKTAHEAADHIEAQAARIKRLEAAARDALGMLDDPTGGEHVRDMRAASHILRSALAKLEKEEGK